MHLLPKLSLLALAFAAAAHAAPAPAALTPDSPVAAADRAEVVATLGRTLQANYVFPDVADQIAAALDAKARRGGYDDTDTIAEFVDALTADLRTFGDDLHFFVGHDPSFEAPPEGKPPPLTAEQIAEQRRFAAERTYGIQRLQRLPGNVGYLDVRAFGPVEFVGGAMSDAMSLLGGTDALILDLRNNHGGDPNSVAYLVSHFFAEGDARHLVDFYERSDGSTRQSWTSDAVSPRYGKPVYVLTSKQTISGGEECAYDLQTQQRATLVGETTAGAANPGGPLPIGHGFVAFVPTGRPINPITKTNWEHVGVKPDVATTAEAALATAYRTIVESRLRDAKDPEDREWLQDVLARLDAGTIDLPAYRKDG